MAAKAKTMDFSGVKESGGFRPRRRAEGDYYAHIVAVDDHMSKDDNPGWVFTIKVDGDSRASYPYYCGFATDQLWKSRGLAIAAGLKVPAGRVKMDPNKLVGRAVGIALVDDEYEGRVKSAIDGTFPIDDITDARNEAGTASTKAKSKSRQAEDDDDEDEDDEDDAPPAKKAKATKSKAKRRPADDDDEDDDEQDSDADDDDEDEPPAKKKAPVKAKASKKKAPVEDDDEDEDDDDDEPEPPKKTKGKKASSKKRKPADDDDDDELDLDEL